MSSTSTNDAPLLIAYDGSDEAAEAIAYIAALAPGAPALVLTAWRPISEAILAVSLASAPPISDPADADERQRRAAEGLARDGARRATQAGLRAEPLAVRADESVWEAIDEVAREREVRLIVCGTRAVRSMESMLHRVPIALVLHANRPVLVVPSQEAVAGRTQQAASRRRRS